MKELLLTILLSIIGIIGVFLCIHAIVDNLICGLMMILGGFGSGYFANKMGTKSE